MKKIVTILVVLMLLMTLVGCQGIANNNPVKDADISSGSGNNQTENVATNQDQENTSDNNTSEDEIVNNEDNVADETDTSDESSDELKQIILYPEELAQDERPLVTITLSDDRIIQLMLVPEIAPNTVNNYISLIESGYYEGIIFHRVIKDFMIQGGDPNGDGSGGPGYTIEDEFYVFDEANNSVTFLPHFRGVLSMAKTSAPDSAGSQFFICHQDAHHLNGQYAAFGFVVEGMDVIDDIANVNTGNNNKPVEDIIIKNITVELNGYEAQEPVIIETSVDS